MYRDWQPVKIFTNPNSKKPHACLLHFKQEKKRRKEEKHALGSAGKHKKRSRHPLVAKKLCSILCSIKNQPHK
jgi:hypothetical protein